MIYYVRGSFSQTYPKTYKLLGMSLIQAGLNAKKIHETYI